MSPSPDCPSPALSHGPAHGLRLSSALSGLESHPRRAARSARVRLALTFCAALGLGAAGCGDPDAATTAGGGGATGTGGAGATGGEGGAGGAGGAGAGPLRSSLYPEDWTPALEDAQGRFLHDFSYAGFRYGEAPDAGPLPVLDAVEGYGADPTGAADSTPSVQAALDAAAAGGGGVVFLGEGLFRFDDVLTVIASHVVLRGAGPEKTRLHFTRTAGMSDTAHLLFQGPLASDAEASLVADGAPREDTVLVEDAAGIAAGDDVSVGFTITPDFVEEHGMTDTWQAFNGTWQPFFRRTVTAVDTSASPNVITLDVPLRYPAKVRDGASVRRETGYLTGCGVESLAVANAAGWDEAWAVDRSHAIALVHAADGFVRDVASFPSPGAPASGDGAGAHLLSGGILVRESKRVTVQGVDLAAPQNRGPGGNGYLFEIRQSSEVLVQDSRGTGGRHNFIQNWGFGTTGCVLHRVESREGKAFTSKDVSVGGTAFSEYHHSLATANLVDSSLFDDGFSAVNRNGESSGAGHSSAQSAFWNVRGEGLLRSLQFGWGYVIGTTGLQVVTESPLPMGLGTEPWDMVEGLDRGADLVPPSLYEDQRERRLSRGE
jgi:hypothetical protein